MLTETNSMNAQMFVLQASWDFVKDYIIYQVRVF